MKRWFVGLAVLVSCGPPKPATTVPAPVAKAEPVVSVAPPTALVPPEPTLRLPRNFLPTGYAARLDLDPAKAGFEGAIQIAGNVAEPSLVIWLNAKQLTVHKAVAQRAGQPDVVLSATAKGDDFLELRAAQPLEAGAWTLAIDYAGTFDALNTSGAFKQTVGDASYVYSQFEAVYARRAFPCFDEPDSKVPWQLTLDVPKALIAVSNTAMTGETPLDGGKKRVEFGQTRPLPSYLVAFGVGPFEIVDAGKTKRGTPVRIIALAHRAADAAYAAKTSAKVIDLLEDYFATPYPYEKMDMLAIPITVGFGAMENAGLITYTETLMLMDGKASNERRLRWISVAAHELAHQWFGDLVTMAYWDDIWLNEGFASWMGRKTVARFDPAWHEDQGELATRDTALESDSLVSARQIRQPIAGQDDIYTAFDRITYDKGASILNMFESYLGAETFQRGVRDHLAAHAYGNATSTDFAAAISTASGKDVNAAFQTFLEQAGTPELTTTLACEGGKATVALAQQRYLPPGSGAATATKPWILPVCVAYDAGGKRAEACTQLDAAAGAIALESHACPRWVMPNVNGRGYYRNHYTAAQIGALRDEAWPPAVVDRAPRDPARRRRRGDHRPAAAAARAVAGAQDARRRRPLRDQRGDHAGRAPVAHGARRAAAQVRGVAAPELRAGRAQGGPPAARQRHARSRGLARRPGPRRGVAGQGSGAGRRGGQAVRQVARPAAILARRGPAARGRRPARAVRPRPQGGRGRGRSHQAPGHAARAGQRA